MNLLLLLITTYLLKPLLFIITVSGDVLEPENNIASVGSGGNFALAAARAVYAGKKNSESLQINFHISSKVCLKPDKSLRMIACMLASKRLRCLTISAFNSSSFACGWDHATICKSLPLLRSVLIKDPRNHTL